jgi:hypothetical protein
MLEGDNMFVHERYRPTFELMEEDLAVTNWRVLSDLNIDGYAKAEPAVYLLAHTSPHDENRVSAPYFAGKATDLRDELAKHLRPSDARLAKHAERGERWFQAIYLDASQLEGEYAKQREKWGL